MNYQKVILSGNATNDAQLKTSQNGEVTYVTFSMGVSDAKNNTTFFPVVVFGNSVEAVAKFVTKGRLVLVDGRLEVNDKNRFSIVADLVRFGPERVNVNSTG